MYMTGKNWLSCGAAVALAATLATAPVPAVAFADGANAVSEQAASVDWAKLANGTYTVSVSAKQTPAATSDSVMNSALTKTANLTVKDGTYRLQLQIGSVFGGYLSAVDQFGSFTKGSEPTGGTQRVWTSPDSQNGSAADFTITLNEQTKSTGLVALRFTAPKMEGYTPSAAIQIDTSSVKVVKLDQPAPPVNPGGGSEGGNPGGGTNPGDPSDKPSENPSDPAKVPGDKTAAVKFVSPTSGKDVTAHMAGMVGTTAGYTAKADGTFDVFLVIAKKSADMFAGATYGDDGKAAEVSEAADGSKIYKFNVASVTSPFRVKWKVTAGPHSEVATDVVLDVQEAPKPDPEPSPKPDPDPTPGPVAPAPDPTPKSDPAPAEQPKQAQGMQVGHSYRIPINFTKTGTGTASMAGQYFGDNAVVIPRADGTLEVRFSTNRPDYITSLTYGGVAASVVSESAGSREYSIVVPRSDKDTTVNLSMTISAMNNMTVSADMHLYLSDAKDLGEGSNFHATSNKTGTVPSNSAVTGAPQTGDANAPAAAGAVTLASALAAAGAAVFTRRRAR